MSLPAVLDSALAERLVSLPWKKSARTIVDELSAEKRPRHLARELRRTLLTAGAGKQTKSAAVIVAGRACEPPLTGPAAAVDREFQRVTGKSLSRRNSRKSASRTSPKKFRHAIQEWLASIEFRHADGSAIFAPAEEPLHNGSKISDGDGTPRGDRSVESSDADRDHAILETLEEAVLLLDLLSVPESVLDDETWLRLWIQAADLAVDLCPASTEVHRPSEKLIRLAELPWRRGLLYGSLAGASNLQTRGRENYRSALGAACDNDGTPHHELFGDLPRWVASLLRGAATGAACRTGIWTKRQQDAFSDGLSGLTGMCRTDGNAMGSTADSGEYHTLLLAGFQLPHVKMKPGVRRRLKSLPALATRRKARQHPVKPPKTGVDARDAGGQSDWAGTAWIQHSQTEPATALAIVHGQTIRVDWSVAGRPVVCDELVLDVIVEGAAVETARAWDCVCWHQDGDVNYLEYQTKLGRNATLNLACLFVPSMRRLLVCAAGKRTGAKQVELKMCWPTASDESAKPVPGARQWVTQSPESISYCPLSLPRDVSERAAGCFVVDEKAATLTQTGTGDAVHAALLIEWGYGPKPAPTDVDWQRLTVTENGTIVGGNIAAAYRISKGDEQWLLYRGLRKWSFPRAVVGCHTTDETLVARLGRKGAWESLLEVDGEGSAE